jgi:hypothetical protein
MEGTEMDDVTKKKISEKLVHEIDTMCKYYFRQTLDEVITELRIRCIIARDRSDPLNLISDLHASGVLSFSSDSPVVYLRKAIERFSKGLYGLCSYCGESIPDEWLIRNPLITHCSRCMGRAGSSRTISIAQMEESEPGVVLQ